MAKNFKKTAIKTEKNEKKFKKSDSSVIRGGKRRSNPEKENVHALDCFATLAMTCYVSGCLECQIGKMNKCPKARAVVFEAAPEIEHRRRRRPRERRLKAGKMLRRSILSESPSSCAAKACAAWDCERLAKCETEVTQPAAPI